MKSQESQKDEMERGGGWYSRALSEEKNQKGVLETRCGSASSWSSAGVSVEMESDHLGFDGVGNVLGRTVANKKFGREDGNFKKLVPDFRNEDMFT
jgi:hypothetical protein